MRPTAKDWFFLFALSIAWGSAFLFIKLAVSTIPTSALVAGRLVIAALFLVIVVYLARLPMKQPLKMWLYFFVLAITGFSVPFYLITWALNIIDSSLGGILIAVMPLTVLVLAHFFVDGERMNRGKVIGFLLGFFGIVVLMGPEALLGLGGDLTNLLAQLAILAAAVLYGVNAVIARRMPETNPLVASAGVCVAAMITMLPSTVNSDLLDIQPSGLAMVSVVVLGVFSTAGATLLFFRIVNSAGAAFVSYGNYAVPIVTVLAGMIFLNEELETQDWIAMGLILGGIYTAQHSGQFLVLKWLNKLRNKAV